MQIRIDSLSGHLGDISVADADTVDQLKSLIDKQFGITVEFQVLVFGDVVLEDGSAILSSVGLRSGSSVTLIQKNAQAWKSQHGLLVLHPRSEHVFVLADLEGNVKKEYKRSACSYEDELYIKEYYVDGTKFIEKNIVEQYMSEPEVKLTVVCEGLEVADGQCLREVASKIIGNQRAALQAEIARNKTEADQRIAAIEGATEKYALGDEFQRAQQRLLDRVGKYSDKMAADLLRMLVKLANANVDTAAIRAFSIGCRHYCFDVGLEEPSLDAIVDAERRHEQQLAQEIEAIGAKIDAEAESQEFFDSNANARAYRKAAAAIAHAAKFLV